MRKVSIGLVFSLVAVMALTFAAADADAANTIKLGFNIPLTGDNPDVGASSKNAAWVDLDGSPKKRVNAAGHTTGLQ